jgi:hypothetical protein
MLKYLVMPVGIVLVAVAYWFLSYEPAGTVMLLVFALAMGIMARVLIPTLEDVGPTAPVDPNWHERSESGGQS